MKREPYKIILLISCVFLGIAMMVYAYSESRRNTTTIILNSVSKTETESEPDTSVSAEKNKSTRTTKINEHPKSTTVKTTTTKRAETTEYHVDEEPLYININTAEHEDLCRLDGIGEHLASEIIYYRNENGFFRNIEEIMNVSGIGAGIFEKIKDYIFVENPYYPEDEEVYEYYEEDISEEEKVLVLEDFIPININTAEKNVLMLLPYFDEETADELIKLREEMGGFQNPLELLYMETLTQKQLAEIIDYLTAN